MDGHTVDTLPAALGASIAAEEASATTGGGLNTAAPATSPPPSLLAARILLVRHAVTDFTAQGRLDGRGGADPDLNATGLHQAAAAAVAVRQVIDGGFHLVTSSLARARQTGDAIARWFTVEPDVDAAWHEQSFGDWDGAAFAEHHGGDLRRCSGSTSTTAVPEASPWPS